MMDHMEDRELPTFVCFCVKGKTFSLIITTITNTVRFYVWGIVRLGNSNHGGGGAHDQFNERKWKWHDSFHLCRWVRQSFQFASGVVRCWRACFSTCSCIWWIYLLSYFFKWTSESNHLICGCPSFRTTVISLLPSVWLSGGDTAEAAATFELTNVTSTD